MTRNWYDAAFRFLGGVPDRMLIYDLETNGLAVASDATLITQFGYVLYEYGKVVATESFLFDWSQPDSGVDPDWFVDSLRQTAAGMAAKGKTYYTTPEKVAAYGQHPFELIPEMVALISDAIDEDYALVGFNTFAFDNPVLERHFRYADIPMKMPVDRLFDVGLMEKARLMGWTPPHPGECSRHDWYYEVSRAVIRQKWSLAGPTAKEYGLSDAPGLDLANAHEAAFDCQLTGLVLAAMAERAREPALA